MLASQHAQVVYSRDGHVVCNPDYHIPEFDWQRSSAQAPTVDYLYVFYYRLIPSVTKVNKCQHGAVTEAKAEGALQNPTDEEPTRSEAQ